MQDLNDLYYFAKVVDAGGFAAAGRLLGIPKSRLSRRLAELETRLGLRLLQRSTRKLSLTDIGEQYYRHCQAMLLAAEMADEAVASHASAPRGRLRVSCPVALAQSHLSPIINDFLAAYPQVQLEMLLTNRRVDLLAEGIDVALRVRDDGDQDPALIARKLRPGRLALVAAPALLAGQSINDPADLTRLPLLGAVEADRKVHVRLFAADGSKREIAVEPRLGIDDFAVRKSAALAGLGVTLLPWQFCQEELAAGRLQQLLPEWTLPGGYLQAVYPHRRGMLPAVRAWIEHLSEAFKGDWDQPI